MIEVELTIQVSNADDRSQDRHYRKRVWLPLCPTVGTTIRLVSPKKIWHRKVDQLILEEGVSVPVVVLENDNESFKKARFEGLCEKWGSLGFILTKTV